MFINLKISRRKLSLGGIFLLLLIVVFFLHWRMAPHAPAIAKPTEQINTDQKIMALTINVDWGEEYIPGILDALDQGKAKATFFVTGRWASKHPELLNEIAARGHEIENHGYSHPHPDRLSVGANQEEIKKTETIIQKITGRKTHFYAPPYGEKGASGLQAAELLGYRTILWTLDTVDWRPESTPELITQRIVNPAVRFGIKPNKNGAIILMHPRANTVKALPGILSQLNREGFTFPTLDALITFDQIGNTTSR